MSYHARGAALAFLAFSPLLVSQETAKSEPSKELNNEAIIKLVKAGLSDELIISTINSLPGTYDTSPEGLVALKTARASDKVVAAIILRTSFPTPAVKEAVAPVPEGAVPALTPSAAKARADEPAQKLLPAPGGQTGSVFVGEVPHNTTASVPPRVFLQSSSKGSNRGAARDQSMEMSKDMEKNCPGVQITINQQMANYTVLLNHIEAGFVRDNQIQVANKDGDLISKTKEGGSIAAGMKKVCSLILADWAKR